MLPVCEEKLSYIELLSFFGTMEALIESLRGVPFKTVLVMLTRETGL